jgi:YesN/AraC family two-component response regulator
LDEYRITIAGSPKEALDILETPNGIDLMLLDVRLPGMKGTDLLKIVKQRYPEIVVIMMTAYGSKDVIITSMRNDTDDFIEKPVDIKQLKAMIREQLERKQGNKQFDSDMDYIKYYIDKNIDKKVEMEHIASIMGYSTKYMSRVFKQETGMKFNEYRLQRKIEKAKEFLETTDYRIKQIAYELGYENSESFVRIFKKRTGLSPAVYRKKSIISR